MTSIPTTSDGSQPHQWSVSNRTLIVSADSKRVLAILNGREPLLLPPGSVLQFGAPLGELVVVRAGVIAGEESAIVCVEAEPPPRQSRAPGHPPRRPGYLRPVPLPTPSLVTPRQNS